MYLGNTEISYYVKNLLVVEGTIIGGLLCIGRFDCGIYYVSAIITDKGKVASACVLVRNLFPNMTEANNFPAHNFNRGYPISKDSGGVIFSGKNEVDGNIFDTF